MCLSTFVLEPFRLCTLITSAVLLLSGCGNRVVVRDATGRPVQGAIVKVCYPSFNGPTIVTNPSGIANLGFGQPDVYSLVVYKDGYTAKGFSGRLQWPLYVVLDDAKIVPDQ